MLALAETSRCTNSAAASRRRTSAIVMLHAACEKRCRSSFCRAGAEGGGADQIPIDRRWG